jgi:nucleoid-associated protein YgaU
VRAKVQVALREYENPLLIAKRLALGDPETFYRVRRNDTLIGIAARELNDPALWRVLARANDIDNPLALTPGDTLFIPEIENDYQHQVRT